MGKTLGIVTVDEAPRRAFIEDIAPLLGPDVDVLQAGILDGLGAERLREVQTTDPDRAVLSRLDDGTPVLLDAGWVAARLPERVAYVEDRGADVTLFCSTVDVEPVPSRKPVVYPGRLLPRAAAALAGDGALGVVVPLHRQHEAAARRWAPFAARLVVGAVHPDGDDGFSRLAETFVDAGVRLVVLDSFGYSPEVRAELAGLTGLPVLCPRRLMARIVAELL